MWGARCDRRFVVLTGGEPLLQVDVALIQALHRSGFEIAVETNGGCRQAMAASTAKSVEDGSRAERRSATALLRIASAKRGRVR